MENQSLFDNETNLSIVHRIKSLNKNAVHKLGEMTVNEMLIECQAPLLISLYQQEETSKPILFSKTLFKNASDKQTTVVSKIDRRVLRTYKFSALQSKLIELVRLFFEQKPRKVWNHPTFGSFTTKQWGFSQYKYLDQHLKDFNV